MTKFTNIWQQLVDCYMPKDFDRQLLMLLLPQTSGQRVGPISLPSPTHLFPDYLLNLSFLVSFFLISVYSLPLGICDVFIMVRASGFHSSS